MTGETFDLFVGSHDGYRRLADPVWHRRFVFHVKGGIWFVRDIAYGHGLHLLQSFWHFAPGMIVRQGETGIVAIYPESANDDRSARGLALLAPRTTDWQMEFAPGIVSPAYGAQEPAPAAFLTAKVRLPAECCLLLMPVTESSELGRFEEMPEPDASGVRGYRYDAGRSTRFVFFGDNSSWRCGPWSSDASVLYGVLEDGRLAHLVMVSGSYARWQDKHLIGLDRRVERFEWVLGADGSKTFGSDDFSAVRGTELNFEFLNPVL